MISIAKKLFANYTNSKKKTHHFSADLLLKTSRQDIEQVFVELGVGREGLSVTEVETRLQTYGKNDIAREKPEIWYWMLLANFKNPFILVLIVLGVVSYFSDDITGALVVSVMIFISVLMRFMQEFRSSHAAEALRVMVRTHATVRRLPQNELEQRSKGKKDIPLEELVPGDIIYLSAGDMIPADVRLIRSKDLFISQSTLTGESMPVEKCANQPLKEKQNTNFLESINLCFMGSSVVSGFGKAIVIATGAHTYLGSLAKNIIGHQSQTNFDKGITKVTLLLIRFILIMVPIIFLINGILKDEWKEAFLFAIAVAVGLTPEMLPMIVTANLSRGAVAMSRFKVIIKRLSSIQSFGAMNVLCTDKTGTLTQNKIILEKYLDFSGENSSHVLEYGFLNSYYQSGLKNMLDHAILEHGQIKKELNLQADYKKVDEIPFDFVRKRLSVVVSRDNEQHLLICKGAVDGLKKVCKKIDWQGQIISMSPQHMHKISKLSDTLSEDGFRVIAVAYKALPVSDKMYSIQDENDFTYLGLMAFLDPPKESACEAIKILHDYNVNVKILTGDNEIVTKRVCQEVNLPYKNVLLGPDIEKMSEEALADKVEDTTIFARLTPLQKSRIILTLKANGQIVGFLGDGINDAAGLRDADVGITVDTATDIARESADIILLEKSLLVLGEGVIKGREVYGNIIKYIKMTTSSNFGNVFSVLIASIFLPFLPMLPLQLLIQNLLYDFSQLSIPWDRMDKEFLKKPRTWDPRGIEQFMFFIGPISSIFDITTFLLLWYIFKANSVEHQSLFQSGWFIEGLLSQILIVHMIRTKKIPFFQSTAATPVILTTIAVMAVGIYLPYSWLGPSVQLTALPYNYFGWLVITLIAYCVLVQFVKGLYIKKFRRWL